MSQLILRRRINDEIKKWNKLGKQRDPEEWEMWPSMVNAYYNPPANEVGIDVELSTIPADLVYVRLSSQQGFFDHLSSLSTGM